MTLEDSPVSLFPKRIYECRLRAPESVREKLLPESVLQRFGR